MTKTFEKVKEINGEVLVSDGESSYVLREMASGRVEVDLTLDGFRYSCGDTGEKGFNKLPDGIQNAIRTFTSWDGRILPEKFWMDPNHVTK